MRISRIEIDNFKSLVDFSIDLDRFNCIIGLNGSGKSTLLQAVDFLSQLISGNMKSWLAERNWKPSDLKSKLSSKNNIAFRIEFLDDSLNLSCVWESVYNPGKNRCYRERFESLTEWIDVSKNGIQINNDELIPISFEYEGSILSQLKPDLIPESIRDYVAMLRSIQSLDLLAPEYLRQRTRQSSGTLGLGGQNLASFLHEMSDSQRLKLVHLLKKAYPHLRGLHVKSLRSGWKQLEIYESYKGQESGLFPSMTTDARHINDGMLRMIAILAELQSENQFLLFDEIENGINPELIEFVIAMFLESNPQVLVTTHSPMILNYLDDDVARKGVIYLYKTAQGVTKSIPFFSIPSLAKKLEVMGPGEAFVDTNLTELADEIAGMSKEEA
jgi:predicted ATPase